MSVSNNDLTINGPSLSVALTGWVSSLIPRCYHICTLFLPQGGNQARITVNCLCDYRMNAAGTGKIPIPTQPYNVYNSTTKTTTNPVQNYVLEIHIYSSNGGVNSSGAYTGGSNACSAAPAGSILATNGVFWGGFAINKTPNSNCQGIFLAPQPSDILNYVDVWMIGYANMGVPLATVIQTAGSASNLPLALSGTYAPTSLPPANGYLKLPIYSPTLTQFNY